MHSTYLRTTQNRIWSGRSCRRALGVSSCMLGLKSVIVFRLYPLYIHIFKYRGVPKIASCHLTPTYLSVFEDIHNIIYLLSIWCFYEPLRNCFFRTRGSCVLLAFFPSITLSIYLLTINLGPRKIIVR